MPKIDQLQTGFTSGELSPLMYGDPVNPRYKKGLKTALNYLPTLQGPLNRRPATKFMNPVKDSTNPPVLIPFTFSQTQTYQLEFGDKYIRFYANNGQIVTPSSLIQLSGFTTIQLPTQFNGFPFYATRATNLPGPGENINSAGQTTITAGNPVELQSPYAVADVPLIRYAQNADTLYLVHPKYPPFKLQRAGQTFWTISMVNFQDGPYLALNSYKKVGDSLTTTLTTYANAFAVGGTNTVGLTTGPVLTITNATNSSGLILITTSAAHSLASGASIFITGIVGTIEANCWDFVVGFLGGPASWVITVVSPTTFTLNGSAFVHTYTSGGAVSPALFAAEFAAELANSGTGAINNKPFSPTWNQLPDAFRNIAVIIAGIRYWGVIMGAANAANITMYCPQTAGQPPNSVTATAWQLGKWSNANGYPGCTTFHQNRLAMSGATNYPQDVDLSHSGTFEQFEASVANGSSALQVIDSNGISETLSSNDINLIFWMKSTAQGLLAGSYTAEWAMTPNSQSGTLTPTNFNAQQTSFYGSAQSDAVLIGNAAMYIQRARRKLREMTFFFQAGTFISNDMSELSEHITIPSITQLAVQKETQPILWALRSDGALLSMVYNRDNLSLSCGWTRHFLGGQSDTAGTPPVVTSISIIPDPTISFDQLWMVVRRYINGATVYMIEYMTNVFNDGILQEDAFQGDCGATFYNPLTISGISIASTAVVASTAHGLSNGNQIKIVSVVGLNKSTTDVNGNVTIANLVNEKTFVVAGVTTNTFQLNDFSGNPISSIGYSTWSSSGQAAKLVTTISGLTWLENETVSILADGALHPDVIVSNSGTIALAFPAAKVQIGYSFKSQAQMMRIEGGAADGTSFGKFRRVAQVAIQVQRCGDMSMGIAFNRMLPIEFTQGDVTMADTAVPLFSGMVRVDGIDSIPGFNNEVCFQQSSMLPGTVQSVTTFVVEQDT